MTANHFSLSAFLHFKYHRLIEYLSFYPHYVYHKIFHEQSTYWESWKGALLCDCGFAVDLGYSYGQHCEKCYEFVSRMNTTEKM